MGIEQSLAGVVPRLFEAAARRPYLAGGEIDRLLGLLAAEYAATTEDDDEDPVTDVAASFGLTDLDADLLTIAAAPELDVRFGAVMALLLGTDRWWPTVVLALELCGRGSLSADARHRLGPSGPLVRHELVVVDGSGPALLRSLHAPARVVAHLLGDCTPDPDVEAMRIEVPGRADEVADLVARAVKGGARLGHVRARAGTAGIASARGAFDLLGADSLIVDVARRSGADRAAGALVRLAVREAGLAACGLVVTGVDSSLAADRSVLTALAAAPLPVLVVDDLPWQTGWYDGSLITVEATALSPAERAAHWRTAVDPDAGDPTDWENLVGLRMTPEHIAAAIEVATVVAGADDAAPSARDLHDAAREHGRQRLESAGLRTVPQATLADLILPAPTRQALDELVSWARNREALLSTGRLTGRGTKGHGLTALFAGSPGTGKTLAAEAVAGELGLELCTVDLSLVIDKYIGETEKHLEQVISEAENLNVVLFFDEADSLFGSRSAVSDARDRYANQEVAYLLQRIERFEGLAVLATNLRGNLDAAFARRLHHVITFTDPDAETRRSLWEVHLAEVPTYDEGDPLDLDWLVEAVELTGGDIRNIVMTAAFAAAAEPSPVGMRHVLYGAEREYRKQAKRMPTPPPAGRPPLR
jgi:predicted nucleic acid-binding protein